MFDFFEIQLFDPLECWDSAAFVDTLLGERKPRELQSFREHFVRDQRRHQSVWLTVLVPSGLKHVIIGNALRESDFHLREIFWTGRVSLREQREQQLSSVLSRFLFTTKQRCWLVLYRKLYCKNAFETRNVATSTPARSLNWTDKHQPATLSRGSRSTWHDHFESRGTRFSAVCATVGVVNQNGLNCFSAPKLQAGNLKGFHSGTTVQQVVQDQRLHKCLSSKTLEVSK